jgi:crossover junction endodeoxyribonuclease RusA
MIRFTVAGVPGAQGSKRHVGGGRMVEQSARVEPWREAVRHEAQKLRTGAGSRPGAGQVPDYADMAAGVGVRVILEFTLARPKAHYRTGKLSAELRADAPEWQTSQPDLDKLCRSTLDGLVMGGLLRDDRQVCVLLASKRYGATPGCDIELSINE